ncbi:MAG: O-antigen ligase family protein [Rhizobiaceae bacterium]|nr:O-antigen ligase family protein [Rhizobiaceae bacterium]
MSNFFWTHLHRSDACANFRWAAALFIMLAVFPGIGSAGTGWLVAICISSLGYWIFDPQCRRLIQHEQILAGVCTVYFLIMAGLAAFHGPLPGQEIGWGSVLSNLPFLFLVFILPVLRLAAQPGWIGLLFAGNACGGILAALIILIAGHYAPDHARTAFSGNELILALGAMVSGLLSIHGLLFFKGPMRGLMALGALAALFALLSSGSRGPLLSYGATLALYAMVMGWRYFGFAFMTKRAVICGLLIAAFSVTMIRTDPELSGRVELVVERLENPSGPDVAEDSILMRIALYKAGLHAFAQRPLTGYGRQNVIAVVSRFDPQRASQFPYTHLHNGYLTDMVASGLPGLLSLLAVLLVPLYALRNAQPVVFGGVVCLSLSYLFYGMTNLLFYHDTANFLFLGMLAVFSTLSNLPELPSKNEITTSTQR